MGDTLRLTGIRGHGRHGVYEQERLDGQEFIVDLELDLELGAAGHSDELEQTVHYGILAEQVHAVIVGEPVRLIETLAERIAAVALDHAAVSSVLVTVHKPSAPIAVPFDDVSVTIRRRRA